jgi:hypothetical protein
MLIRREMTLGIALVLLAAGAARAEAEQAKEGEEHKALAALAGEWEVSTRFIIDGKEFQGTASCSAKWILDGRVLQQQYKSKFMGQPFEVLQLLGYDPGKKKFYELMMNSQHHGVMHNLGTFSANGKVLTCHGERLDPMTNKSSKLRTVTTIVDRDTFVLEWYFANDAGKEEKAITLTHKRKK